LRIGDDRHAIEETMDNDHIARNLACVEKHFHSEAVNEVEAALDLYTDDIIWDAPALNGLDRSFSGKQGVAKNYYELFASMRNVRFQCLQRFATEDRVVDDSIVRFEIARAGYWRWPVKCETGKSHASWFLIWAVRSANVAPSDKALALLRRYAVSGLTRR
jgi:hypothetical protein